MKTSRFRRDLVRTEQQTGRRGRFDRVGLRTHSLKSVADELLSSHARIRIDDVQVGIEQEDRVCDRVHHVCSSGSAKGSMHLIARWFKLERLT